MSKHVHVSNTLIIDDDGHYVASTTNCYESEQTNSANAQRIAACLNACAGINPEAVPDVVAALRAVNALHPRNIPSNLDEFLQFWDAIDLSRAALAKLEE